MRKKVLPDKIRMFELMVHDKNMWQDRPVYMHIDASENPEQVIGEAMGYYAAKYPGYKVRVSSDFNGGFSQYSVEDGQFVDHAIDYDINRDLDVSKIQEHMIHVLQDTQNLESYKPTNPLSVLYEKPEKPGVSYDFHANDKDYSWKDKRMIEQNIPNLLQTMDVDRCDARTYAMMQFKDDMGHAFYSEVLHRMPDEFRPHILSVNECGLGSYHVEVQIGDDLVSDTVNYDVEGIRKYGKPSEVASVGTVWNRYMIDHVIREKDLQEGKQVTVNQDIHRPSDVRFLNGVPNDFLHKLKTKDVDGNGFTVTVPCPESPNKFGNITVRQFTTGLDNNHKNIVLSDDVYQVKYTNEDGRRISVQKSVDSICADFKNGYQQYASLENVRHRQVPDVSVDMKGVDELEFR